MKLFLQVYLVNNIFEDSWIEIIQIIMHRENGQENTKCLDCGMSFETPGQLLNHKRRFCINSGYDNLDGLAKIQFNGVGLTHQPKVGHRNYLQQYGANSLTKIGTQQDLSSSVLEKDMKNVNRFKRQLQGAKKYEHNNKIQPKLASSKSSSLAYQSKNMYLLDESQIDQQLKKYQKNSKEEAISPPTYIDQLNMKNQTVLDKSNSSLGRMSLKDRIEYAKGKLDQLNEIKELYMKNGGNKNQFKVNVQKMIEFYKKFLKENEEKHKGNYDNGFDSQQLIQSRVSTPILKLRQLNQSDVKLRKQRNKQSAVSQYPQQNSKSKIEKQNDGFSAPLNQYPYSYPQPQVIMMPYAPPPVQNQSMPNDGFRLLEKMIQLKSEENQRLLQIMLEDKRRGNISQQPTIITLPQYSTNPGNSSLPVQSNNPLSQSRTLKHHTKGYIDVEDEYQFKKSMIQDLISEEKVLLSLQQEQIDEIKLLSQLPIQLQQIKIKSIVKASQTRHKVEKEILKQKLDRLSYQQQNQTFQELRKVENDRWAGQERKRLLQNQMNQYINNFEEQFKDSPQS